jgi:molybdenum cofactor synthesis domain-containing protein
MCDLHEARDTATTIFKTIPVGDAVGMVLAHDITEIRKDEFKGRAFRKGHIIRADDLSHLKRLGKEHLYVLSLAPDEMHEDDAAASLAAALMGPGVRVEGEPREGKINIVADRDGLLTVNREALLALNMLGDVMCATRHGNTVVRKGDIVGGTRAIPLVVKRGVIDEALRCCRTARSAGSSVIEVREMRKPKAGIVITGNEVYHGRIQDAFAPVISKKIEAVGGEIVGLYYAPDDTAVIEQRLRELLSAGADLLITTGGMSVDPDDVTRFAIRNVGATDVTYGSPVLPGSMFLVGYLEKVRSSECGMRNAESTSGTENAEWRMRTAELGTNHSRDSHSALRTPHSELIPILGIPACGMYHAITVFDLVLPRVLAGRKIGRRELAELGYGGLCLQCKECRYPVCPFGK